MTEAQIQEMLANDNFVDQLSGRVLAKADTISQATGLLWYDLSPVVQLLYPFRQLIPLISKLPRVPGDGGNAYHWKRISGINVGLLEAGVSEGNRGGTIALQLDDQVAAYKALGFESSVTFEARLGSKGLNPDAIGNAVQSTLRSLMIAEEKALILGNASNPLGQTPRPNAGVEGTAVASGFTTGTAQSVILVALTGQGWLNSSVANGIKQAITRTNADGSSDTFGGGSAIKSSARTYTVTSNGDSFIMGWSALLGAVAYAVFWGPSGSEVLGAIVFSTTYTFTGAATGTQTAASLDGLDHSTNALVPDGILPIIFGEIFGQPPSLAARTNTVLPTTTGGTVAISPSGSLYLAMSGTQILSSASHPAIDQFDAILQAAYEQYKIGFDRILVNVQQVLDLSDILLAGAGSNATPYRINFDATGGKEISAGFRVTSYMNKFMGNTLPIEVHPFIPPGTILFWSDKIPYELPNIPNIFEAHVRQDYYEIQWPLRRRAYEYGVYTDEVFACYFCPAFAAITNILAGH